GIQMAWHANDRASLSPGTASTGQVSPPTTAIFSIGEPLGDSRAGSGASLVELGVVLLPEPGATRCGWTDADAPGDRGLLLRRVRAGGRRAGRRRRPAARGRPRLQRRAPGPGREAGVRDAGGVGPPAQAVAGLPGL